MEDLKKLSVHELAMKLNNIIKAKSQANVSGLELIAMDYMWNTVVMELWERIPSLKDDVDIQPVLTSIPEVLDADKKNPKPYGRVKKIEQDK